MASTATVVLRGELDMARTDDVTAAITNAITADTTVLVIDLSHVEFMDSAGLGCLAAAHRRMKDRGVVRLRGARPQVVRLVSLVGLDDVFEFESSATVGQDLLAAED
jgi:anti-sigma B factor antagonist